MSVRTYNDYLIPPEDSKHLGAVMTNFDHSIEPDAEARLKAGNFRGQHSAWDFCGLVWWDPEAGLFREVLFRYHCPIANVEAPTLAELMAKANEIGGSK